MALLATPTATKLNTPAPTWTLTCSDEQSASIVRQWAELAQRQLNARMANGYLPTLDDIKPIADAYNVAIAMDNWARLPNDDTQVSLSLSTAPVVGSNTVAI